MAVSDGQQIGKYKENKTMAYIIDRSYGADIDKVLSISGEQIGRTISIGGSWRWLRIGMLYQVSQSNTDYTNIPNANLAFGLSAGTSSLYADITVKNFVGVDLDASKNLSAWYGSTVARMVIKSGSVYTFNSGDFAWDTGVSANSSSKHRAINFIDYIKADTDPGLWCIRYTYSQWNGNPVLDSSPSVFYAQMTNPTCSLAGSYTITSSYMPVSESINGYLDTINIFWNKSNAYPPIEISEIAAYRFA